MSPLKIDLRPAEPRDASAIAAIYAPIVRDTFISFETEPPSALMMAERIQPPNGNTHGLSQLWATRCGATRTPANTAGERPIDGPQTLPCTWLRRLAEKGVGRRLYGGLIPILRAQGFRGAFAGIALPNDASVGLHEAVGFRAVGVYKDVGFKLGAWRDVGWWRLELSNDGAPPSEPRAFSQFRETPDFGAFLV